MFPSSAPAKGSLYASEDEITDYRPDNPDIVPLLYQSGYLTLKEYDERYESFSLCYPNEEVKYGFTQSLTPVYLNSDKPLDDARSATGWLMIPTAERFFVFVLYFSDE